MSIMLPCSGFSSRYFSMSLIVDIFISSLSLGNALLLWYRRWYFHISLPSAYGWRDKVAFTYTTGFARRQGWCDAALALRVINSILSWINAFSLGRNITIIHFFRILIVFITDVKYISLNDIIFPCLLPRRQESNKLSTKSLDVFSSLPPLESKSFLQITAVVRFYLE